VDSYLQAEGRGTGKATICVEDDFARFFAIEIMRRCDPDLLAGCSLLPIGGGQEIPAAVKLLRDAGVRAVGLTDGDMPEAANEVVSGLPGTRPPEIEVFTDGAVKYAFAAEPYNLSPRREVLSPVSDHHQYVRAIAKCLMLEESFVATTACRPSLRPVNRDRLSAAFVEHARHEESGYGADHHKDDDDDQDQASHAAEEPLGLDVLGRRQRLDDGRVGR
jgi:hypothetical protein